MIKAFALFVVSLGAALAATYLVALRPLWRQWGVDPTEATQSLPGDDLVPEPRAVDTRGLTVAAPPSAVWPWLVQMGYGRAGWYSYDAIDMAGRSVTEIHPEWQSLAVDETVQTDPRGGFRVKVLEPERCLVLYYDTVLMREQMAAAAAADAPAASPNVRATGVALSSMTPPEFSISWAFVLQPTADGGTRLIERFRLSGEMTGPAGAVSGRALALGIFTMTRKQMLGIKERAERVEREARVLRPSGASTMPSPDADGPPAGEPELRVQVKVRDLPPKTNEAIASA
ncbi:MAG TPA: hypothetical protein VIF84_04455 [Candidatus Limnocylindrales bacterium]